MQKPDWSEWRHIPRLKLWQACALSLDTEPHSVEEVRPIDFSMEPIHWSGFSTQAIEREFQKRLRILNGNNGPGGSIPSLLPWLIKPADFVGYATSLGWTLPTEMISAFPVTVIPKQRSLNEIVITDVNSWSPEDLKELVEHHARHGLKKTAEHYKISQSRVTQLKTRYRKENPSFNNPFGLTSKNSPKGL